MKVMVCRAKSPCFHRANSTVVDSKGKTAPLVYETPVPLGVVLQPVKVYPFRTKVFNVSAVGALAVSGTLCPTRR